MSCSYYAFRQGDYYCYKKEDYINSDVYYRYCRSYSYDECPIYKDESNSSSCYLTSACIYAKNLPDDCEELTVLRTFRDNWLRKQPCGECEIAEYYAKAPQIVAKINASDNADHIWDTLYHILILPCVQYIHAGQMEAAHTLYRSVSLLLSEQYCR